MHFIRLYINNLRIYHIVIVRIQVVAHHSSAKDVNVQVCLKYENL